MSPIFFRKASSNHVVAMVSSIQALVWTVKVGWTEHPFCRNPCMDLRVFPSQMNIGGMACPTPLTQAMTVTDSLLTFRVPVRAHTFVIVPGIRVYATNYFNSTV